MAVHVKKHRFGLHFKTYRFADYKEQMIDLLQRVCTISVETMQIIQQIEL
ncbi:MAG: hypothetical protein RMY16_03380 [Nostoc sp. DedQUE12b]|nr:MULTISPECIES: hypothetical protein [unclassified Nostoc]MDZ7949687.1 hypothetical protein [Nostoc sp. DedQUE09]MDZ8084626.1 hypothetical protein [Nostoc sp. DedQUE12b]